MTSCGFDIANAVEQGVYLVGEGGVRVVADIDGSRGRTGGSSNARAIAVRVGPASSVPGSTGKVRKRLPAAAMDDVGEGAPIGLHDRLERTVRGISDAEKVGDDVVVGHPEDGAGLLLVFH